MHTQEPAVVASEPEDMTMHGEPTAVSGPPDPARFREEPAVVVSGSGGQTVRFPAWWDAERVARWLGRDGGGWLGRFAAGATASWELPPGVTMFEVASRVALTSAGATARRP